MEGETCQHDKYGYCRYKNQCKENTLVQNVKILKTAKTDKSVRRYAAGNGRFENGWAYKHQKPTTNEEKVEKIEKSTICNDKAHVFGSLLSCP